VVKHETKPVNAHFTVTKSRPINYPNMRVVWIKKIDATQKFTHITLPFCYCKLQQIYLRRKAKNKLLLQGIDTFPTLAILQSPEWAKQYAVTAFMYITTISIRREKSLPQYSHTCSIAFCTSGGKLINISSRSSSAKSSSSIAAILYPYWSPKITKPPPSPP